MELGQHLSGREHPTFPAYWGRGRHRLKREIYRKLKVTPMHDELGGSAWDCRDELRASDSLIGTASSVRTRCVVGSAEVVRQDKPRLSSPVHPEFKLCS